MQFSQAARMRLFAISHSRNVTLSTMGLRDRLNVSAAVRIPKDGEYLFGGKLLESVDTDITMHKRAKEVASRLAKPRRVDNIRRQRLRQFTSFSSRGRSRPFRARGRGFGRSARGRGGAYGRGSPVGLPASIPSRKCLFGRSSGKRLLPSRGSRIPFYPKVASGPFRSFYSFRSKKWLSNFSSEQFSRGHSENHRDPEGSKGDDDPPYSRRDTGSDFQKRDRSNKRFSESVFVPDLCDPQEIGGSVCHPESQRVQSSF